MNDVVTDYIELCSRPLSYFYAFWCFPQPILAIFNTKLMFAKTYLPILFKSILSVFKRIHYSLHDTITSFRTAWSHGFTYV